MGTDMGTDTGTGTSTNMGTDNDTGTDTALVLTLVPILTPEQYDYRNLILFTITTISKTEYKNAKICILANTSFKMWKIRSMVFFTINLFFYLQEKENTCLKLVHFVQHQIQV